MRIKPSVKLYKIGGENTDSQIFSDLLQDDSIKKLKIPEYQRPYSWTKDVILTFLRDINVHKDQNKHYYIGASYFGREGDTTKHEIIDGQQRIVTFLLASKILLNYYNIPEAKKILETVTIELSSFDNEIWTQILRWNTDNYKEIYNEIQRNDSETVLQKRKTVWKSSIKTITLFFQEELNNDIDVIKKFSECFFEKLESLPIVSNDQEHSDAFFNSINGKGLPLSDIDLIKSFLFSKWVSFKYDDKTINFKEFWKTLILNTHDEILTFINYFLKKQENSYKKTGKVKDFEKYFKKSIDTEDSKTILSKLYKNSFSYRLVEMKKFQSQKINFYARMFDLFKFDYARAFLYSNADLFNKDKNKNTAESIIELLFLFHILDKINNPNPAEPFSINVKLMEETCQKLSSFKQLQDQLDYLTKEVKNKITVPSNDFLEKIRFNNKSSKKICLFLCTLKYFYKKNYPYDYAEMNTYIASTERSNTALKYDLDHLFPQKFSKDDLRKQNYREIDVPYFFEGKFFSPFSKNTIDTRKLVINQNFYNDPNQYKNMSVIDFQNNFLHGIWNLQLLTAQRNKTKSNKMKIALDELNGTKLDLFAENKVNSFKSLWNDFIKNLSL